VLSALGRDPGDDDALDASFSMYLRAYEGSWRAYDDVVPALAEIAELDLGVAVLTNGADEQQRAKVRVCGIADLVGPLFSSDVIGVAKPEARAFARAHRHQRDAGFPRCRAPDNRAGHQRRDAVPQHVRVRPRHPRAHSGRLEHASPPCMEIDHRATG
jgi:hypothetical protein